jgi:hypothetical protein
VAHAAILATQEVMIRKPAQANSSARLYLKKPFTKIGLVEWLKIKALCSRKKNKSRKE